MLTDYLDPQSHAARAGVTCRSCGTAWPCPGWTGPDWHGHGPSLIPNGTQVTTLDDLDRLVTHAAGCPVVLDRDANPWTLYAGEDGDGYAHTVPCPDVGLTVATIDLEDLPGRGPLRVVWNGDPHPTGWPALPATGAVVTSRSDAP